MIPLKPSAKLDGGQADALVLAIPAAIVFGLFVLLPVMVFIGYSFLTARLFAVSTPLTIMAYVRALTTTLNAELAMNSAAIGALTAISTLLVGVPVAYFLRFHAGRLAAPLLFIIAATMFASYLVRIYAWRTILGGNGIINKTLLGIGVIDEPYQFLLYNWFSVTVALVHIFVPYVILVLYAALRPVGNELLEAAQDLGANAPQRWWRVVLPLIATPIVTNFLFVFVLSASDYVTPQLIGGTSGQMLGVQIQSNFKAIGDWPQGSAISILMLLAFLALSYLCFSALKLVGAKAARGSF